MNDRRDFYCKAVAGEVHGEEEEVVFWVCARLRLVTVHVYDW